MSDGVTVDLTCKKAECGSLKVRVVGKQRYESMSTWSTGPGPQRLVFDYECGDCGYVSGYEGPWG